MDVDGWLNLNEYYVFSPFDGPVYVRTLAIMRRPQNVWLWVYLFNDNGQPVAVFCGSEGINDTNSFAMYVKELKRMTDGGVVDAIDDLVADDFPENITPSAEERVTGYILADGKKYNGWGYYHNQRFVPHGCGKKFYTDFNVYGNFNAVTKATQLQFSTLTEKAKELGATTSWTATQVAEGMLSLGRMGFDANDIDKMISGVMDLGRALDIEVGDAAKMMTLFWVVGYNNTAYLPSLLDVQSSLTLRNSSSSEFTLTVMSVVSVLVPFVLAYIAYCWYKMDRRKLTSDELDHTDEKY